MNVLNSFMVQLAAAGERPDTIESLQWKEMLFSVVLFSLFAIVLGTVVWPKVLKYLNARETTIRDSLQQAEKAAAAAQDQQAELAKQLAEAQTQAAKIVEDAKGAAEQIAAQIKADAEKAATDISARAQAEIASAKEQAIAEVAGFAGALSTDVASKILAREVTAADQQQLVDSAIAELSQA